MCRILDKIAKWVSWLTLAGLLILAICRKLGYSCVELENSCILPVLTAAAVGYLTNWIAIWLLFKPYNKHFFGMLQGVIPRNRDRLGHELGELIPEYLLDPDELVTQLGDMIREYLQNPELITDLRGKINLVMKRYSGDIAGAVVPWLSENCKRIIAENTTREKLLELYDNAVPAYFSNEENRSFVANAIVGELKKRVPEAVPAIRQYACSAVKDYIRDKYPLLSGLLNADEFAAGLVMGLDWDSIAEQLKNKLQNRETQQMISGELVKLTEKLREYLQSPEADERIAGFLTEKRVQIEEYVRNYLTEHLPGMVDEMLKDDKLWDAVQNQLLPLVQSFVLHSLKRNKEAIIGKLNLSGRIEDSVARMDMQKLHEMLLKASDNNLTMIQLLGYILGGAAGLLLAVI